MAHNLDLKYKGPISRETLLAQLKQALENEPGGGSFDNGDSIKVTINRKSVDTPAEIPEKK